MQAAENIYKPLAAIRKKMEQKNQKNKIIELISNDNTEEAFKSLLSNFNEAKKFDLFSDEQSQLVLLKGRYEDIKKQQLLGIIGFENFTIEKNKIRNAILEFINKLPDLIWNPPLFKESSEQLSKTNIKKITKFKYDVFLCHSSQDEEIAKSIWRKLNSNHINVFFSTESLKQEIGLSFIEKIENALTNSRCFLLVSTANSMNSEWVKVEYETFFNECYLKNTQSRKFIVYRPSRQNKETVPIILKRLQHVNDIDELVKVLSIEEKKPKIELVSEVNESKSKNTIFKKSQILLIMFLVLSGLIFFTYRELNNPYQQLKRELIRQEISPDFIIDNTISTAKLFSFTKLELREQGKTHLKKIAKALLKFPEIKVEIIAHTDNFGEESFNLELSTIQARFIHDFLIKEGIKPQSISFKGEGEKYPIESNESSEGRIKNRRIELKYN